jgi:hypothetical protein
MVSDKYITVKDVSLNNNCPECFSKEGLQLTFKQQFNETSFSKSVTDNISTEMHCKICDTAIYPERWTEDIERIYEYQFKAFTPKKKSKKYKKLFWILLSVITIIVVTIIAFLITKTTL